VARKERKEEWKPLAEKASIGKKRRIVRGAGCSEFDAEKSAVGA